MISDWGEFLAAYLQAEEAAIGQPYGIAAAQDRSALHVGEEPSWPRAAMRRTKDVTGPRTLANLAASL